MTLHGPRHYEAAAYEAERHRRSRIEAAFGLLAGLDTCGDAMGRVGRESHACDRWWEDDRPQRMTRDVITLDGEPVWEGGYEVRGYRIEWCERWAFER